MFRQDYNKYQLDGCKTMAEIVECLESQLQEYKELRDLGVILDETVSDGWVWMSTSNEEIARKYRFDEEEFDNSDEDEYEDEDWEDGEDDYGDELWAEVERGTQYDDEWDDFHDDDGKSTLEDK